jgi:hypothetical protein
VGNYSAVLNTLQSGAYVGTVDDLDENNWEIGQQFVREHHRLAMESVAGRQICNL